MNKMVHAIEYIENANKEAEFVGVMAQVIDRYKQTLTPVQLEKSIKWAGEDYSHITKK